MILKFIVLALLIFTNEMIAASINRDENESDRFEVSSDSTVLLTGSPDLTSMTRKTNLKRIMSNFDTLGSDMILYIGEYLEFPHLTLGQLSSGFRDIFRTISPSKVISIQLNIIELSNFKISNDLKYFKSLSRSSLNDERILTIIIDVALIKSLPNIKGPLLRLLYLKSLKTVSRSQLLKPIHPFENSNSISPIGAFISGFFELNDFEFLFDILEKFPEIILNDDFLFNEKFIESAGKLDKLNLLYQVYSRINIITFQNKFDFVCRCLSITFKIEILNLFLKEAYKTSEYWNDKFSETFLNAWIFALTQADKRIIEELLPLNIELVKESTVHLAVRKQTLIILLSVRVSKDKERTRLLLELFVNNFDSRSTSRFKIFYEEILWALVIEKDHEGFFFLLRSFDRLDCLDSSKLRLAIAKTKDDEFISGLFNNFNLKALFSNNFYGEAVYNKRLFLALTHHNSQEDFIQNSLLSVDLFEYAIEHFKNFEDWEQFFKIKSDWSAIEFAQFFEYLLNHSHNRVDIFVFDMLVNLLKEQALRIVNSGRPSILLNVKTAEFILKNENLNYLLIHLNRFIKFNCNPRVMSHLITSNSCSKGPLLKLLIFSVTDLLIQLPHWIDHEKYRQLFGLSHKSYLNQLKEAMTELKRLNSLADDQESFDKILIQILNPTLLKLKWENPVDYLSLFPRSVLIRKFSNDPIYMKKAIDWAKSSGCFGELAFLLKGIDLKVKGPVDIENIKKYLYIHKIRLIIKE
jgi:hypothetical protein